MRHVYAATGAVFQNLIFIVSYIDQDAVALPERALQHTQRERIQHPALNRALERARAIRGIVALLRPGPPSLHR